jgi:hypothetical protein
MAYFALDSGWAGQVRELGQVTVDRCAVTNDLYARDQCVDR